MKLSALVFSLFITLFLIHPLFSQEQTELKDEKIKFDSSLFSGLKLRCIGPAFMSGRIVDIAINPENKSLWFIAVASGGVWKTVNAGTTWKPVFDSQGSYSIGCVTIDPNNPTTVWVGTGENNSQRSVGFGDGVYKSVDNGVTWKNTGLKKSEHIGKIVVDPRDSNTVFVAAQGPLWASGGDRGLYKTTDGGAVWNKVLEISENTGVSDIAIDPSNPDVMYASSYQRRRHVWTLINGGPESAVYKTTDGGASWNKLTRGLPGGELGRIGLAVSSIKPDVVYAIVEAEEGKSGFYRSSNKGLSFKKMSSYLSTSPQYYQEIAPCPHTFDKVYSLDTRFMVTLDGGKTFKSKQGKFMHVDHHAIAFDNDNPNYLLVGCDGGLYESFDQGATWLYKANLPITQFYRVCTDNDEPFYNVYGGTQDNSSQGGPSRTISRSGITNGDWFLTKGGDGFESQVDPLNPNIVYSQSQHGVICRYDKINGERIDIKPQPGPGEDAYRWNWDSPLLISPHSNTTLYFAANILFRSEDRGDSWKAISPDLSRRLDRNILEVMGRVWSMDAVSRHRSTSVYGNIVSISESPMKKGLIYIGTDDGLIQVTENGGSSWRRIDRFPEVPELAYVSDIEASLFDENIVFACFSNHKMGDFKPYIIMSRDKGLTWSSIAGDFPENGPVWTLAQDHVNQGLLFAGSEFGLHFTIDEGLRWIRLKGGLPVIAMRDIEIQRRENDLVCASFGRGFYILDDITPLRHMTEKRVEEDGIIFPVKKALLYTQSSPNGYRDKGTFGDAYYTAPNPPFGAIFTYYLKEGTKTKRSTRLSEEKKAVKESKAIKHPTLDQLKMEAEEETHGLYLVIKDESGNLVRRIKGENGRGFHRTSWDLRYPDYGPISLTSNSSGPMVVPGIYKVHMERYSNNKLVKIGEEVAFEVVPLGLSSFSAPDRSAMLAFHRKVGELQRAVHGASGILNDAQKRIALIRKAVSNRPEANPEWAIEAKNIESSLKGINETLSGDRVKSKYMYPAKVSIRSRLRNASSSGSASCTEPTKTHIRSYEIAADEFPDLLSKLRNIIEVDLKRLEKKLEDARIPWTPGRFPEWKK